MFVLGLGKVVVLGVVFVVVLVVVLALLIVLVLVLEYVRLCTFTCTHAHCRICSQEPLVRDEP